MDISTIPCCIEKFISTKIILTNDEITFINNLINDNPVIFQKVTSQINAFLANKSFSLYDIPAIINILAVVYKNELTVNHSTIDIYDIIEFSILALLYGNAFGLNETINDELENMVKSAMTLLKTNMEAEKRCLTSFWLWISNIFRSCSK